MSTPGAAAPFPFRPKRSVVLEQPLTKHSVPVVETKKATSNKSLRGIALLVALLASMR